MIEVFLNNLINKMYRLINHVAYQNLKNKNFNKQSVNKLRKNKKKIVDKETFKKYLKYIFNFQQRSFTDW